METYLIIAEKPKAAEKIAYALGFKRISSRGAVPYWVGQLYGSKAYLVPAAGHLFTLKARGTGYPIFHCEWVPRYEADRGASYTKKFLTLIARFSKTSTSFINACDYDIEGSVIGYLIIKFLGDERKAFRVKFSSLTTEELRSAFGKLSPLDTDMVEAGLCRHELDWLWGINVSRALMDVFRALTGKRYVLSAGRVQSPTLMQALKRQNERETFVPEIYFTIDVMVKIGGQRLKLVNDFPSPLRKVEAARIAREIRKNPEGYIADVTKRIQILRSPPPFNLPDLQTEASRILGLSPSQTLKIAEALYLNSLISYPRTNSQKLPASLNNRKIIEGLSKVNVYREYSEELLRREALRPVSGKKIDPAHPAIYPTGYHPAKKLRRLEWRVYDLIVRRYLATFGPPAKIASITYRLRIGNYNFLLRGATMVNGGWSKVYRFLNMREKVLPDLKVGDVIPVVSVRVVRKFGNPPPPYTKLTLLRWMESVNIGTEATRADILEVLFRRGYLRQKSKGVEVTKLGTEVASLLGRFFSDIVSVDLTRSFEEKLALVKAGRMSRGEVVKQAVEYLRPKLLEIKELIKKHRDRGMTGLHEALGRGVEGRRCVLCGRLAEGYTEAGTPLCRLHFEAYRNIQSKYDLWRERSEISFCDYLKTLVNLSKAGKFVKDVATYLLSEC